MEQQPQLSEEQLVQKVYEHAAALKRDGKSEAAIQRDLEEQGLGTEAAQAVAGNIEKQYKEELRTAANKNMAFGALWCVGGTVVTLVTMSAASGGGTYVIAWGAIIFGAFQFFKGLSQRSKS